MQLMHSVSALSNVNALENQIRELTTQVIPSGDWPDDLAPLPSLRTQIATMFRAQGNLAEALKQGLKGCLMLEIRTGDTWVRNLFKLLQVLSHVLTPFEQDTTSEFPRQGQAWIILYGYLHEAVRASTKTFSSHATYTKAIEGWYRDCLAAADIAGIPTPRTRAFSREFKRAHKDVLVWAGIGEERGIVLT
jgi:hypothetical protein